MDSQALASKLQESIDALTALKAEASSADSPAQPSSGGPDLQSQLSDLQTKFDELGKERDAKAKEADDLREAVKKHLAEEDASQADLQKLIDPIEVVPVVAEVPKVSDVVPAAAPVDASASASASASAPAAPADIPPAQAVQPGAATPDAPLGHDVTQ